MGNSKNLWIEKEKNAKEYMASRKEGKILIEVSTQHPLKNGETPAEEFENRLITAINIYNDLKLQHIESEFVVSGSLHLYEGIADKVSLSEAGKNYLLSKNIPENIIHGQDLIDKYKGANSKWSGVYNSADEVFVASSYFKDNLELGNIYSIVSPAQLHRKALTYIWLGVIPFFYTAPCSNMFHSFVEESYYFSNILENDPDFQADDSIFALKSRQLRMPGFKN